jgi:hypothetical protein
MMDLKDFFKVTNQKLKITALFIVFFYVNANFSNLLVDVLTPSLSTLLSDTVKAISRQSDFLNYFLVNFLALIIISYIFACIIVLMFPRKGKK